MGISSVTREAAQYLRDCHKSGEIVTVGDLAELLNVPQHRARSIFQNAYRFAQSEYGIVFTNERGVGWRPVSNKSIAKVTTQKNQRRIVGATEAWRKELALVNHSQLDECGRTEFHAATTKLLVQSAINNRETQKLIEQKASHDRLPPRREMPTKEYAAKICEVLGGKYFG